MSNPPSELPRCCAQERITVAPQVNEKTRQKHDYAGPAHRDSYARRTAAERTYASMADPSVGGIRRGWCRLFGRAKNALMYALAVLVRNVRILESLERQRRKRNGRNPSVVSATHKASSTRHPGPDRAAGARGSNGSRLAATAHAPDGAPAENLSHPLPSPRPTTGAKDVRGLKTGACHTRMLDSHPGHRLR